MAKYSLKPTARPGDVSANRSAIFLDPTIIPDAENLTDDQTTTVELLKKNHFDISCLRYTTDNAI